MTQVLSFPFRLGPSGSPVTVQDGSDDFFAEQLAVLILTRPGERALVPEFGMSDPVFTEFDSAELVGKVQLFGPPVNITEVNTTFTDASTEKVVVYFDSPSSTDSEVTPNDEFA